MRRIILLVVASTSFVASNAMIINIPADYPTIQQGINSATDGDTVLVQPGNYVENINFNGKNIIVTSLYLTTNDTTYISTTVISSSPAAILDKSVVTFESNETSLAKLIGITLQHGGGNYRLLGFDWVFYGGGVYCNQASPTFSHLKIIDNDAECGGGIFLYYSDALIEHCEISNNVCNSVSFSSPNAGGAMAIWNCQDVVMRNNKVQNNNVERAGGAFYSLTSNILLVNSLITDNHSGVMGSAFYLDSWSNLNITNTTVYGNECDPGSGLRGNGVMYCLDSAKVKINNSIFYNNLPAAIICQFNYSINEVSVANSDFEGGMDSVITNNGGNNVTINWISGNLNINPQLVNAGADDFHLLFSSPCINTGDTVGIIGIPLADLDNQNRFNGLIDMGCYEFQGTTGINDALQEHFFSVYPNPANDNMFFDFSENATEGIVALYNLNGAIVYSQKLFVGQGTARIPVSQLANGVYFLNFSDGKITDGRKIVIVH